MNTYGLPTTYIPRLQPEYFNDVLPDSDQWQRDVYTLAAWLARRSGVKRIVDIGCGRAEKLMKLANEFQTCGIDYGQNIDYCKQTYPDNIWLTVDLDKEHIPAFIVHESVVICADVIEHIPYPDKLVEKFRIASKQAAYVLISTPDRERINQGTPNGMPANKAHVREWTRQEFTDWLKAEGLPVIWSGWTVSYAKQPDKRNTILVILSNSESIEDMPLAFEEAH